MLLHQKIIMYLKIKHNEYRINRFEKKITNIRKEVDKKIAATPLINNHQKILFTLSFNLWLPNKMHDFFLVQSLKLRGANIIPLIEGHVQEGETSILGGLWGGFTNNTDLNKMQSQKNTTHRLQEDNSLWKTWSDIEPLQLDSYITQQEKETMRKFVTHNFSVDNYKNWTYENMPVGKWAQDVLCNNELVGNILMIQNYEQKLKAYLLNIIFMIEALKKALNAVKPDIIISNNSFYYPWSILEILAKRGNIPFFCQGPGDNRDSWHYALNQQASPANLSELWSTWKNITLSSTATEAVTHYLQTRQSGNNMVLNTAQPHLNSKIINTQELHIANSNNTALLAANVIWDAAALGADLQFKSTTEWIIKVINFFEKHPQFNLIIKAHPGEKNKHLPLTQQLLEDEIKKFKPQIPPNIYFLGPLTNISCYKLFPFTQVGLIFTSTIGIEMACQGIPIILSGKAPYAQKGFTLEPENEEQYFDTLKKILENDLPETEKIKNKELALKFLYVYHFVYAIKLNLFKYSVTQGTNLLATRAKDLLPGANPVLDHICDSILQKKPIMSSTRWPAPDNNKFMNLNK